MYPSALEGIKVVELAQWVSGPYCGKVLADLGATVVKIEEPEKGDLSRHRGPFPKGQPHPEKSGLFLYLNANKLGITLDVSAEEGRDVFKDLVRWADVLVENNPPKIMEEWRLDYPFLSSTNSSLIVASITPFGQTGPYRDYRAYNLNTYLMGGPGYLQGNVGGKDYPLKLDGQQADFFAGLTGAAAVVMALVGRDFSDKGAYIDVSALEGAASILEAQLLQYTYWSQTLYRKERDSIGITPIMRCKDGYMFFVCVQEEQWHRFRQMLGNPDWAFSGLFDGFLNRLEHIDALAALSANWFASRTKEEAYREAQAYRLPFAPIYDMKDLDHAPHLKAREYFTEIEHRKAGQVKSPGPPYRLDKTPWRVLRPAPLLGEHNDYVYRTLLGYGVEKIKGLRMMRVI